MKLPDFKWGCGGIAWDRMMRDETVNNLKLNGKESP